MPDHKTVTFDVELRRIAHELRTYNPQADEYHGEHIHKVWAKEIDALLAAPTPAAQSADHSGESTEKVPNHVADSRNMVAAQSAGQEACWAVYNGWSLQAFFQSKEKASEYASEMQKNHDLSGSLAAFVVKPLYTTPANGGEREYAACKGMNCGCTDGKSHSPECEAEHAAAIAGGAFVKSAADAPQVNGDLHGEIMNIRCTEPEEYVDAAVRMAYRVGHRDARHAAAELVCMEKARAALTSTAKVGGDDMEQAWLKWSNDARFYDWHTTIECAQLHFAAGFDAGRAALSADAREAPLDIEVRAFLENLAKANSEPLNSVGAYKDRASRIDCMLNIRNHARALLARAALSADGGDAIGQKKAAFLKHEGAVETGVMLRAENRIALVTYQGRVEWYDANEFGGIQLSADGGEDKRDAERLSQIAWLIASIFVHGGFKAETHNERELERLLRENGTFFESVAEYDAANQAHKEQK